MADLALLVEGNLDEAVGRRIVGHCGLEISVVYGKKGFAYIKGKIGGFNKSARGMPMLTLVDLMDTGLSCPPVVLDAWLPRREPGMLFRVVVREVESWLLADRPNLADFLRIAADKVPSAPEEEIDPKRRLVNLARKSRSAEIRRLLVPAKDSTATEGPAYTSEMRRFVEHHWDVEVAEKNAPSLASCIRALKLAPPSRVREGG